MAEFEIIRPYPGDTTSVVVPFAAALGIAVQLDNTVSGKATCKKAAAAGHLLGFLSRNVTADGATLAQHTYEPLELDSKIGDTVSVFKADAVEVEGSTYLVDSGTGQITTGTSADSDLSFTGGRWYVAQTGDHVFGKLAAQLDPETAGQTRIRIEVFH